MTVIVELPYARPPLTENQRMHWRKKAAVVASVRQAVYVLARNARVPQNCAHVDVSLHYTPRDVRRRDADNLVPTLKAACDGLVDAGLVADDTPDLMTKQMPTIHPAEKGKRGRLWLELHIEEAQ
ncbi:rusA-like resolvase [Gordonia phage Budski]|nr:rusA-like resolvase [Gordonia phage Budski]